VNALPSKERTELRANPVTLICFAVKEEAKFFPKAGDPKIRILVTGMGRRNAEQAVRRAIAAERPDLVLTAGFAGGLNPDWSTGTVVFDAEGQPALTNALLAAGARPGRFFCSDKVATTTEEKRALRRQTSADAVEMESEAIVAVCREQRIPAATIRVILDAAAEDLPLDFNALMDENKALDSRKLALVLIKSPCLIPRLLRLQKQSRAAAQRLAAVLERIV